MKKGIHPNWHQDCVVTCSCGNSFTTGSTSATLQVDICSACHPFFTGEMKFVDRQGRVDKFMQKVQKAQQKQAQKKQKKTQSKTSDDSGLSYKHILQAQKATIKQTQVNSKEAA